MSIYGGQPVVAADWAREFTVRVHPAYPSPIRDLAASLLEGDPLRVVGEANPPQRLKMTTGWREALATVDAQIQVEARLHHTLPPWIDFNTIHFHLDLGRRPGGAPRRRPADQPPKVASASSRKRRTGYGRMGRPRRE